MVVYFLLTSQFSFMSDGPSECFSSKQYLKNPGWDILWLSSQSRQKSLLELSGRAKIESIEDLSECSIVTNKNGVCCFQLPFNQNPVVWPQAGSRGDWEMPFSWVPKKREWDLLASGWSLTQLTTFSSPARNILVLRWTHLVWWPWGWGNGDEEPPNNSQKFHFRYNQKCHLLNKSR